MEAFIKEQIELGFTKSLPQTKWENRSEKPLPAKPKKAQRINARHILMKEVHAERLSTALFLSLFTGVRMGELLALTWGDVDEKKMTIQINHNLVRVTTYDEAGKKNGTELIVQIPKTKKSHRIIPVQEDMFRLLMQEKTKQEKAVGSMGVWISPYRVTPS